MNGANGNGAKLLKDLVRYRQKLNRPAHKKDKHKARKIPFTPNHEPPKADNFTSPNPRHFLFVKYSDIYFMNDKARKA